MIQKNVAQYAPEVFPVCAQRVFEVCFQITPFRLLDAFQRVGLHLLIIKRRKQTGFGLGAQFLHLGGV